MNKRVCHYLSAVIVFLNLASCGLIPCGHIHYEVLPISYNEYKFKKANDIVVTNLSTTLRGDLCIKMHLFSDSSYILDRNQFVIYAGNESIKPKFLMSWVNDTLQTALYYKGKNNEKINNRKKILIRKGDNDILLSAHVHRAFSEKLRLTYRNGSEVEQSEIFNLNPQDIIFDPFYLNTKILFSQKKIKGENVRMSFIGEERVTKQQEYISEVFQEGGDSLRFFMLTFDRMQGYDINLDTLKLYIPNSEYNLYIEKKSTFSLKTKDKMNNYLPHIIFRITNKYDKPVTKIPPLYILPGNYLIKDGKTFTITDTIEIYNPLKDEL